MDGGDATTWQQGDPDRTSSTLRSTGNRQARYRRSGYRYILGCDFDTLLTRNQTIRPASHRNLLNNKLKIHDTSLYYNFKAIAFPNRILKKEMLNILCL